MKKLDRLFWKHRDKGIKRLMLYLIIGNVAVFVMGVVGFDGMVRALALDPAAVLRGQIWRLVTFLFIPNDFSFFFVFFAMFYYWIGSALESLWGSLKFNAYYLTGTLLTIGFSFIVHAVLNAAPGGLPPGWINLTGYYVNLSLFLALATLGPDNVINLMGILPIKMKWLAIIDVALMALPAILAPRSILSYAFAPAIVNYLIYLGADLYRMVFGAARRGARGSARTVRFKSAVRGAKQAKGYIHKCAECGVTDTDAPGKEFRYCSLCSGYQCYCSDHIFSHTHRK